MTGRLSGKIAFISAAGQGIGRGAAIAMAREGAQVWATDVNASLLDSLAREPSITTRVMDVTDDKQVAAVTAEAGAVDILFNCAGYVHQGNLLSTDDAAWDRSFDINVRGMFLVTKAMLPKMIERGGGSVICVSSVVGAGKGLPNRFAYGVTKAAVQGFVKSVACDYVKQGIRCNALCPGTVDTPSLQDRINSFADPVQARQDFVARQPMGRLATVDDIVPLVVYLASDESRFVTGQIVYCDGGITI